MIIMDFKGVTWVGNVYQKFEAMCLEVEEIIVQDTVKYVENQVQTVGASVKKFYADVVQDLRPPLSVDPIKVAAGPELPEEQYVSFCAFKGEKQGASEEVKVDNEKLSEDSKSVTHKYSHAPNYHGLYVGDNTFQLSSQIPDLYSRQYSHGIIRRKSNLGIKRISRKDTLVPSVTSEAVCCTEKDFSTTQATSCSLSETCNLKSKTSAPVSVEVSRCNPIEETSNEIENASECSPAASNEISSPDMRPSGNSIGDKQLETGYFCSGRLSTEPNAVDLCINDGVVSEAGSSVDMDVQHDILPDKVVLVSYPDAWTRDSIKINTAVEQGSENIQQHSKKQLEESCVVVSKDDIHHFPSKEGKRRPYKKKVHDALSLRMRLGRKKEYEELAVQWHGDIATSHEECRGNSSASLVMVNTRRSPPQDTCDSEWEFL